MTVPVLPSEQSTRGLVSFTPCELLPKDSDTARGLAAANGDDPDRGFVFRDAVAALAAVLGFVALSLALSGCASFGEGMRTARDVAKIGCAVLEGTDGTPADVLERTQELQRIVLSAAAQEATVKGADTARLEQDMRTITVLAETLRTVSLAVVQAAGNAPVTLVPCPAPSPTTDLPSAP